MYIVLFSRTQSTSSDGCKPELDKITSQIISSVDFKSTVNSLASEPNCTFIDINFNYQSYENFITALIEKISKCKDSLLADAQIKLKLKRILMTSLIFFNHNDCTHVHIANFVNFLHTMSRIISTDFSDCLPNDATLQMMIKPYCGSEAARQYLLNNLPREFHKFIDSLPISQSLVDQPTLFTGCSPTTARAQTPEPGRCSTAPSILPFP